jgi:ribosomal protein S19
VTDLKTKVTKWTSNNEHGKYAEQLHKPGTETEATHTWLRRSYIFPETGGIC